MNRRSRQRPAYGASCSPCPRQSQNYRERTQLGVSVRNEASNRRKPAIAARKRRGAGKGRPPANPHQTPPHCSFHVPPKISLLPPACHLISPWPSLTANPHLPCLCMPSHVFSVIRMCQVTSFALSLQAASSLESGADIRGSSLLHCLVMRKRHHFTIGDAQSGCIVKRGQSDGASDSCGRLRRCHRRGVLATDADMRRRPPPTLAAAECASTPLPPAPPSTACPPPHPTS
eukprot:361405-Chlamydomonas_euryale.AAC.5